MGSRVHLSREEKRRSFDRSSLDLWVREAREEARRKRREGDKRKNFAAIDRTL